MDYQAERIETEGMQTTIRDHALRIHSLHDARLSCACGRWEYVLTGRMTKTNAQREFLHHVYPTAMHIATVLE